MTNLDNKLREILDEFEGDCADIHIEAKDNSRMTQQVYLEELSELVTEAIAQIQTDILSLLPEKFAEIKAGEPAYFDDRKQGYNECLLNVYSALEGYLK